MARVRYLDFGPLCDVQQLNERNDKVRKRKVISFNREMRVCDIII